MLVMPLMRAVALVKADEHSDDEGDTGLTLQLSLRTKAEERNEAFAPESTSAEQGVLLTKTDCRIRGGSGSCARDTEVLTVKALHSKS